MTKENPPQIAFVRELCKGSSEEEIRAAEARLIRYLELCQEIAALELPEENSRNFDNCKDDL